MHFQTSQKSLKLRVHRLKAPEIELEVKVPCPNTSQKPGKTSKRSEEYMLKVGCSKEDTLSVFNVFLRGVFHTIPLTLLGALAFLPEGMNECLQPSFIHIHPLLKIIANALNPAMLLLPT